MSHLPFSQTSECFSSWGVRLGLHGWWKESKWWRCKCREWIWDGNEEESQDWEQCKNIRPQTVTSKRKFKITYQHVRYFPFYFALEDNSCSFRCTQTGKEKCGHGHNWPNKQMEIKPGADWKLTEKTHLTSKLVFVYFQNVTMTNLLFIDGVIWLMRDEVQIIST